MTANRSNFPTPSPPDADGRDPICRFWGKIFFFSDVAVRKRPFLLPEVEKKTKVKKKNKQNTNFGPIFECRLASRTLIDGRRFFSHFCWTRNFSIFSLLRLHFSSLSLRCTAIDCWCCFRCCRQTAAVKTVMANQNKSTHWQTTTEGQQKLCLLLIRLRFDLGPLYRGSAVTLALVSTATLDQFTPVNKKKNITKHLNTLRRCRFYLAEHVPFLMKKKLVIV